MVTEIRLCFPISLAAGQGFEIKFWSKVASRNSAID